MSVDPRLHVRAIPTRLALGSREPPFGLHRFLYRTRCHAMLKSIAIAAFALGISLVSNALAQARDGYRQVFPATSPPATWVWGLTWSMAFDEARSETVLFGVSYNETWVWDGVNWTQRHPVVSPQVCCGRMAYDAARAEVVLVAGATDKRETWVCDGVTWTQKPTPIAPCVACSSWSMAYDAARGELVGFGGGDALHSFPPQTWVWNGSEWTQRFPSVSPTAGELVYDSGRSAIVLFGGQNLPETWIWDGVNWSERFPATSPPADTALQWSMTLTKAESSWLVESAFRVGNISPMRGRGMGWCGKRSARLAYWDSRRSWSTTPRARRSSPSEALSREHILGRMIPVCPQP